MIFLQFFNRTRLFVQGSMQNHSYVDQEGIKRFRTSIVPSKKLQNILIMSVNIGISFNVADNMYK